MIKNVIFDLDGTLWQTTESYVYAYRKLCDYYKIDQRVSDEVVKTYLGVRLDVLLNDLFPTVEDKRSLAYRAMNYSIEYLLSHKDDCCYDGVSGLLSYLSKKYDVYIVSNCLKEYVETFLSISDTKRFVKGYYTIESGEKREHIAGIASASEDKTLFVGDCDDDYTSIADHYRVLFCYAAYGYKPCRSYDFKIGAPRELEELLKSAEIKERQLKNKSYKVISYKDNQLTVIKNPNGSVYFGYTKYVDEDFGIVLDELNKEGFPSLIGPINGNTFYPYRFAADHFETRFCPDCTNGEKELKAFFDHGFTVARSYVSTIAKINYKFWDRAKKVKIDDGYTVKTICGKEAFDYVDDIYDVATEAFRDADYYEEISREDFRDIYVENFRKISPDLFIIYYKDEPIAFNFCYGDPVNGLYVCKTTAVKDAFRNGVIIMKFVDLSYDMMVKKGYKYALHHFQKDRGSNSYVIYRGNEVLQKKYVVLEKV